MKKILLFTCVIALLTTTGCFFPGRGGGGDWHGRRGDADVAPAAVAVRTPEVVVEHPEVEVRAPEVIVP